MVREKSIKIRLTEEEFEKIVFHSKSKGFSVSEVIRDYIKSLPKTESLFSGRDSQGSSCAAHDIKKLPPPANFS